MATLPVTATADPTLEAIDAQIVARQHDEPVRGYLGMSAIGEDCERRLWYGFRFAGRAVFDAVTLRRFEDGHRCEDLMAARLRMVPGVILHTKGTDGRQFGFKAIGGHFRGNIDGAVQGLLQAPKTWHVWEHKASEKGGELLRLKAKNEKAALAAWSATYYAQAVCYMHYSGMSRHYLTCDSPGGRTTISVRTDASPDEAARLEAKALRIITAPEPLARLSEDPAFWKCKQCPALANCHQGRVADVSCRTCVHATAELDGDARWSCAWHKRDLSMTDQLAGCGEHRFIPGLIPGAVAVDANPAENWIEYKAGAFVFRNGARAVGSYSSNEINKVPLAVLQSPELNEVRAKYLPDAEFTAGSVEQAA